MMLKPMSSESRSSQMVLTCSRCSEPRLEKDKTPLLHGSQPYLQIGITQRTSKNPHAGPPAQTKEMTSPGVEWGIIIFPKSPA